MVATTIPKLHLFYEDQSVGELSYEPGLNDFKFSYSLEWKERPERFPLSPHIPFEGTAAAGVITRFLENLLPEGRGLKDLAQSLKIPTTNTYALIAAIGREATGAFIISESKSKPATVFRPLPKEELIARIQNRKSQPLMIWDGKPRLSLAGVQEKLGVVVRSDGKKKEFGFGEGDIASTHILKFGNERVPHLVLNEYFCMTLAKLAGLKAADCELLDLSERVLQVERFDRKWINNNHVSRSHIIDGCQALDISPEHKYERFLGDTPSTAGIHGPANLANLYTFTQKCATPAKEQLQLLKWVFFNLVIGNCDHHIKNISYYVRPSGISTAPTYDLVNVSVYLDLEQSLAFQIGEAFTLQELNAYHFAEMAKELNLGTNFVSQQLTKTCKAVLQSLKKLNPENLIDSMNKGEHVFMTELRKNIQERAERFLAEAPAIKKFKS